MCFVHQIAQLSLSMVAPCRAAVVANLGDFQTFLAHNPASNLCLHGEPWEILGCFGLGDEPGGTVVHVLTWYQAKELTMLQPVLHDVLARPLVRGPVVWVRSPQSVASGVQWSKDFGMCAVLVVELSIQVEG
jgi:malonyl CoA-acyl carrier protein transacylase